MEKYWKLFLLFLAIIFLLAFSGFDFYFRVSIVIFVCLFFTLFSSLKWSSFSFKRPDFILWLLFLASVSVSFFFTQSIPASLEEITVYLLAFLVYWLIVLLPDEVTNTGFSKVILLISVILSLISIGNYFFFPPKFADGTTLVDYYYGHNHLAAVLILVLPLAYYFTLLKNDAKYKLLSLFLFISLLLTVGRIAILIGVLQLITVFLLFKVNLKRHSRTPLLLTIVLSLVFILFVSFPNVLFGNFCNSLPKIKFILCKDISDDGRLYYWEQAYLGFKERPLFGTGPGTFFISNNKYQQLPHLATAYAHNAYLQNFSELGIVGGGSFLLLIFGLLYMHWPSEKKSLETFIFIGILGMLINIFFDFDFNISSIAILFFIYFGMLSRGGYKNTHNIRDEKIFKTILILVMSLLVIISSLFFTDLLITSRKETISKKMFLFNSLKKKYFEKYSYEVLFPYFRNDLNFYQHFYNKEKEIATKSELFHKVREFSKMSNIYLHNIDIYKASENPDLVIEDVLKSYQLLKNIERKTGKYNYLYRKILAEEILKYYDFQKENQEVFLLTVELVNKIYPWLHYKIGYDEYSTSSKSCYITSILKENIGEPFDDHRISVAEIYLHCLAQCKLTPENIQLQACSWEHRIVDNYFEYTHEQPDQLLTDLVSAMHGVDFSNQVLEPIAVYNQVIFFHQLVGDLRSEFNIELKAEDSSKIHSILYDVAEQMTNISPEISMKIKEIAVTY